MHGWCRRGAKTPVSAMGWHVGDSDHQRNVDLALKKNRSKNLDKTGHRCGGEDGERGGESHWEPMTWNL